MPEELRGVASTAGAGMGVGVSAGGWPTAEPAASNKAPMKNTAPMSVVRTFTVGLSAAERIGIQHQLPRSGIGLAAG